MKIWVYDQPREVARETFADYLDPATTAVISIDMHRGHLEDSPDCPCPAPRARDVVAPIDAFHRQVRALGMPVVHVKSVLRPGAKTISRAFPPPGAAPFHNTWGRSPTPTPTRSKAAAGPSG